MKLNNMQTVMFAGAVFALAILISCKGEDERLYEEATQLKKAGEQMVQGEAQEKKFRQAIDTLQQAIEHEPDSAKYHYKLGQCYKKVEEFENAIVSLERSLELDDTNWRTYDQLLSVRIKMGSLDDAEKLLEDLKVMPLIKQEPKAVKALATRAEELQAARKNHRRYDA